MSLVHKHLIIKAIVKKPFVSPKITEYWLKEIAEAIGMVITEHGGPHVDYVEKEGNEGIAGVAMIETSHISCHIWDKIKRPVVHLDVYSCKDFDHMRVVKFLDVMQPKKVKAVLLNRENMKFQKL